MIAIPCIQEKGAESDKGGKQPGRKFNTPHQRPTIKSDTQQKNEEEDPN